MKQAAKSTLVFIGLMWVGFGINLILPVNNYGIVPRSTGGLVGIFTSPFLHANFAHISANTLALLTAGWFFYLTYQKRAFELTFFLIFLSGLGTWLVSRPDVVVVGASGFIYAILGFMIVSGIRSKKWSHLITGIVVLLLHGGAIFGVFPGEAHVSWEGHLVGALTGGFFATRQRWGSKG